MALESVIAYTKIDAGVDSKFFRKEILNNYRVIKKVAPEPKYEKIVEGILNKISGTDFI